MNYQGNLRLRLHYAQAPNLTRDNERRPTSTLPHALWPAAILSSRERGRFFPSDPAVAYKRSHALQQSASAATPSPTNDNPTFNVQLNRPAQLMEVVAAVATTAVATTAITLSVTHTAG